MNRGVNYRRKPGTDFGLASRMVNGDESDGCNDDFDVDGSDRPKGSSVGALLVEKSICINESSKEVLSGIEKSKKKCSDCGSVSNYELVIVF